MVTSLYTNRLKHISTSGLMLVYNQVNYFQSYLNQLTVPMIDKLKTLIKNSTGSISMLHYAHIIHPLTVQKHPNVM